MKRAVAMLLGEAATACRKLEGKTMEVIEEFPADICISRNQGNSESAAAHAAILPRKTIRREAVFEFIRERGTKGANNWEIAQRFGVESNAISPRVTELLIKQAVADSHIRRPTASGLMARVVIAVEHRGALIAELKAKAETAADEMERRYLLGIAGKLEADEKRANGDDWEARIDESYFDSRVGAIRRPSDEAKNLVRYD